MTETGSGESSKPASIQARSASKGMRVAFYPTECAGKSVYPAAPVGEYQVAMSAALASGQSFANRSTRSGLLM